MAKDIGVVVEASYEEGFLVDLDRGINIEDIPIGSYVIVSSDKYRYLCIVSNVKYRAPVEEDGVSYIRSEYRSIVRKYFAKRLVDYKIEVIPIARGSSNGDVDKPDTIPSYGSKVYEPDTHLLAHFYGDVDWKLGYPLGTPKIIGETEYSVPINIKRLIDLNFGIFGKSGSGKTFLGNLLVAYTMLYNKVKEDGEDHLEARFLIFDMHNEYSLDVYNDARQPVAGGVYKLFSDDFVVYTPDNLFRSEYRMSFLPIPLYNISHNQLRYIVEPLGVTTAFLENLGFYENILRKIFAREAMFGDQGYWPLGLILSKNSVRKVVELASEGGVEFIDKLSFSVSELSRFIEAVEETIGKEGKGALSAFKAGRRRMERLLDMPVSLKKVYEKVIDNVVNNLVSPTGRSVIISMGGYEKNIPVYMALANLIGESLWRRLNELVVEEGEEARNKIIIMLEEAHKFLGRGVSAYSPFGRIAREMRKRGVIVVPIDQKPSELDPDVLSMLWTFFIFALTDPKDIDASLIGVDRPTLYRNVVASLRRGEALVYGYGVQFPVVIRVHDYSNMYREISNRLGNDKGSIFDDIPR